MADVQESFPTPTTGLGTQLHVALSGSGVTQVAGKVYKASLANLGTLQLTAAVKDVADSSQSLDKTVTWVSYNSKFAAGQDAGFNNTYESYPAGAKYGDVATVDSNGLVTAVQVGQAIIEAQYPFADGSGGDKIYAQLILTVTA